MSASVYLRKIMDISMIGNAKRIINLFVFSITIFVITPILPHGFAAGTLINKNGYYELIENLVVDDPIVSYDCEMQNDTVGTVSAAKRAYSYIECTLRIGDTTVTTHPDQLLWCVERNQWVRASTLKADDFILTLAGPMRVDAVQLRITQKPIAFYSLTVCDKHTFCITWHEIVVHNHTAHVEIRSFPPAAGVLSAILALPAAPIIVPIACAGLFFWQLFQYKKEQRDREFQQMILQQAQPEQLEYRGFWVPEQSPGTLHNEQLPPVPTSPPRPQSPGGSGNEPEDPEKKPKDKPPEKTQKPASQLAANQITATVGNVTKTGSSEEIAKWIAKQQSEIFNSIKPKLHELVKHAKQLKGEQLSMRDIEHIFSNKHLTKGIMQLGK